jgi:hypothetical protein
VYGYENNTNAGGCNTTNQIEVFAHEFGHALSLFHVIADVNSIVRLGQSNLGVQQYEKKNILKKWGQ